MANERLRKWLGIKPDPTLTPDDLTPVVNLATQGPGTATPNNPRKITKGTSYTATGLDEIPAPVLETEQGSAIPTRILELVPDLLPGYQRTVTFNAMLNDAGVDASLRAAKTPVLGAEYFVEPYSDSPQDVEVGEFIWANLVEGMSSPFINSLEDILQMYSDGYAVIEKVYEMREWSANRSGANTKQFTMLKKLGYRPATTILRIDYDDNGGPLDVVQNAIQADGSIVETTMDISKVIIFTNSRRGGDLMGRSLLRTAYPHWYYKTHLYKIDAIQKERNSLGIPKGMLQPGYTQNDKNILRTMLANLRSNEESFMILTPNIDVEFAEVKSHSVNVLESAHHHNMMIFMNVLGQFLNLGIDAPGGGKATGSTQADLFMKSLRHVANYIADCINMYLIPELVVWNYPTTNFPKMKVRNVGEVRDIQMLAAGLANLASQGLVTMDLSTEQWVRQAFDMPAKVGSSDETYVPAQPSLKPETEPDPNDPNEAVEPGESTTNGNGTGTGAGTGNNGKGAVPNRIRPGNVGKPPSAPN